MSGGDREFDDTVDAATRALSSMEEPTAVQDPDTIDMREELTLDADVSGVVREIVAEAHEPEDIIEIQIRSSRPGIGKPQVTNAIVNMLHNTFDVPVEIHTQDDEFEQHYHADTQNSAFSGSPALRQIDAKQFVVIDRNANLEPRDRYENGLHYLLGARSDGSPFTKL